jgi:glucose-1-phosphate cytidylyltransferase
MKTVILAGGFGTRLSEETDVKPKPMVEIGGRPMLWHIMKLYGSAGFNEFCVALGYKGDSIKRYFLDYSTLSGSLSVSLSTGQVAARQRVVDDWTVHLVETGLATGTGGRALRMADWIGREPFMLTYGDGVCDVDIAELVRFHRRHGKLATVTAVRPPSRFGGLVFDGDLVAEFTEKPQIGEGWINGGFMVLEPEVFDRMRHGDDTRLEQDVLEGLARDGQLAAYRHEGFWQCMDTLRDVNLLRGMWDAGTAPWKRWE